MNMDKRFGTKLTEKQLVGKTNGCLTILSLDDVVQINCKGRNLWRYVITVKCNSCGKVFQTFWHNFRASSKKNVKHCKYCYGQYIIDTRTQETGFTQRERLRIASIKSGAKKRNISYNLTDDDVKSIISKPCVYCGKEIAEGIDRVDSMKGYEKGNVVPCCGICNKMKNNYSLEFFKSHIEKIYKTMCDDYQKL